MESILKVFRNPLYSIFLLDIRGILIILYQFFEIFNPLKKVRLLLFLQVYRNPHNLKLHVLFSN